MKYLAAGFAKDAEKLLYDFVKENSTNFSVFATKWKKHYFSAIFLGREKQESVQFTNEIFQVSLGYLQSPPFIYQVGAIYLLYALYRNQFLDPPVRIRIVQPQLEIVRKIKIAAEKNCYINLHYVINYMLDNAFDFTAVGALRGPRTSKGNTEFENALPTPPILKELNTEVCNLLDSNILHDIKDLDKKYTILKNSIFRKKDDTKDNAIYEKYINCLEGLVNSKKGSKKQAKAAERNIGDRRAAIKAASFSRKALFSKLNFSDSEDSETPLESYSVPTKKFSSIPRKRRLPKEKRKVGRPKKFDSGKVKEEPEQSDEDVVDQHYPNSRLTKGQRGRGPAKQASYLERYDRIPTAVAHKPIKVSVTNSSEEESSEETEPFVLSF